MLNGYDKLGYSSMEKRVATSDQKEASYPITLDIIKLIPAIFISNNENGETILKNNSISSSLEEFLNSKKNFTIRDIATKIKINEKDISKIIDEAEQCKKDGKKRTTFAHGISDHRYYHFKITTIRSTNIDNTHTLTTIFRDYTEEYMIRKNISDSNFGLHKTLEKIPYPLLVSDNDSIIYFNKSVYNQFKKDNISDYTVSSLLYSLSNNPELVKDVLHKIQTFNASKEHTLHIEKIDFTIDNKFYVFDLNFTKIDNSLTLLAFSDITEKEEHLDNLLTERSLFGSGPVMVIKYVDRKQGKQVEWVSENIKHFTGYTKEEIISENVDINSFVCEKMLPQLFDEADMFYDKKQENYSHAPYKLIWRDKSEIWVKDHTRL